MSSFYHFVFKVLENECEDTFTAGTTRVSPQMSQKEQHTLNQT